MSGINTFICSNLSPLPELGFVRIRYMKPKECSHCHEKTTYFFGPFRYKRIEVCKDCFLKVKEMGEDNFD